jgi:acetylornithine deacetylase/succinyl-diaminopimelate desuccinylase-like protein
VPEPADLERRATELLQRLIRFKTVNPPGDEEPAQLHLKELLEGAGFDCELLYAVEGRPNLVARMRGGSDGPRLALLAHVDTVLADPSAWSVDPWAGELRDGCVWGRGALDMKSQLASEVAAATALADQGWRPQSGELLLVVTCDEETGADHGARWLCEQQPDKVACDIVVNEGAGQVIEFDGRRVYGVCVAEKGVFRFRLSTEGRAGHASIPRIGDNALTKLSPLVTRLGERRASYRLSPEPEALLHALGVDPGGGSDAAIAEAIQEVEQIDPRVGVILEPLLSVTLTPTMIQASEKVNVIPSHAEVGVDCRVPPGLGEEAARAAIAEVLGDGDYRIEFRDPVVGNRSPIDTGLMEHIREFIAAEDPGAEPAAVALPGFSDSRWFREAFPECVAYGFFPQKAMDLFEAAPLVHGADERVPVEDLALAARFYAGLVEKTLA